MAVIPYSPQMAAKYTLTGPDGTVAVFNDQADANYVGVITEITGLDSADVREAAEDLVEADGGQHGDFWYGRRPIVITAKVYGHATMAIRDARISKIRRATNALRGDATLAWTNLPTASNLPMLTWVRRQQPLRVTGGWAKEVQISLVSEYAALYGATLKTSAVTASGTAVTVENQGDAPAHPILRINGASTNPTITNNTTGVVLRTTGLTSGVLASGNYIDIDVLNHDAKFQNGTSANRYIDWAATGWPALISGNNSLTLAGGGTLRVTHRDAWV